MLMAKSVAVIDLVCGDAGKGTLVNRLCATGDYSLVVRFNGGSQCAHHVVLDDGREHCFAQFGSGTFQGVPTFLSRFMLVEPLSLMNEAEGLKKVGVSDPYSMLTVDARALVTTPFHWLVNQVREEARGVDRHGSCGRGIGVTSEYAALSHEAAPTVGDLRYPDGLREKLRVLSMWAVQQGVTLPGTQDHESRDLLAKYAQFADKVRIVTSHKLPTSGVVFEGAQGVLLDQHVGFFPYVTRSTCTPDNAVALLEGVGQSR